jgi:hypothetical protein
MAGFCNHKNNFLSLINFREFFWPRNRYILKSIRFNAYSSSCQVDIYELKLKQIPTNAVYYNTKFLQLKR